MAGLVATVITKWRANTNYSYGYVRAETLAGFINGLFLLFISFFIFSEVSAASYSSIFPSSIASSRSSLKSVHFTLLTPSPYHLTSSSPHLLTPPPPQ